MVTINYTMDPAPTEDYTIMDEYQISLILNCQRRKEFKDVLVALAEVGIGGGYAEAERRWELYERTDKIHEAAKKIDPNSTLCSQLEASKAEQLTRIYRNTDLDLE